MHFSQLLALLMVSPLHLAVTGTPTTSVTTTTPPELTSAVPNTAITGHPIAIPSPAPSAAANATSPPSDVLANVTLPSYNSPAALVKKSIHTKRSFIWTCNNCYMTSVGPTLRCTCRRANGSYNNAALNVNNCITNNNGNLQWAVNGHFAGTCINIHGRSNWYIMAADCRNIGGNYVYTEITLNERIHNADGNLWCGI